MYRTHLIIGDTNMSILHISVSRWRDLKVLHPLRRCGLFWPYIIRKPNLWSLSGNASLFIRLKRCHHNWHWLHLPRHSRQRVSSSLLCHLFVMMRRCGGQDTVLAALQVWAQVRMTTRDVTNNPNMLTRSQDLKISLFKITEKGQLSVMKYWGSSKIVQYFYAFTL